MTTEMPRSPLASSSTTMDVVSESVPRPPYSSERVMVRMPIACAASMISQETHPPDPFGRLVPLLLAELHCLQTDARSQEWLVGLLFE